MNERIKELAAKCYKTGPLGKDGWPEYVSINEQKFAELIIQECIDAAEKAQADYYIIENIKSRFGVEE